MFLNFTRRITTGRSGPELRLFGDREGLFFLPLLVREGRLRLLDPIFLTLGGCSLRSVRRRHSQSLGVPLPRRTVSTFLFVTQSFRRRVVTLVSDVGWVPRRDRGADPPPGRLSVIVTTTTCRLLICLVLSRVKTRVLKVEGSEQEYS